MKIMLIIYLDNLLLQGKTVTFTIISLFCACVMTSCKKLTVAPPPSTQLSGNNIYNSDATAIAVLTGIYSDMAVDQENLANAPGSVSSLSYFGGLSSDELTLWSGIYDAQTISFYKNALLATPSASYGAGYWNVLYTYIFRCNDAIEGVTGSTGITASVKKQLTGEAKFLRAFYYFYLVNLYGDVPLVVTTDYKANSVISRSPSEKIYQQIILDLHDAQQLLSSNYLDGSLVNSSADRVRPTSWAATAMLARTYLYSGNWQGADSAATAVINSANFGLSDLNHTFLRASLGNNEAIWQIQPIEKTGTTNTGDAYLFILPSAGPSGQFPVYLSNDLVTAFEPGDKRRLNWIDSIASGGQVYYYAYKYKVSRIITGDNAPVTEHATLLRLAEQYLIRAEAKAQDKDIAGSQNDLNTIRKRAGLANTESNTQADLLSAILHERRVELFTELGHRWLDLKRTNTVDGVMQAATQKKGGAWQSFQQLYPISFFELQANPGLKQNPGY